MKKKESDIGLLVSQLGSDAALKILNGELGAYKGAIAENMCAIGFHSVGKDLYIILEGAVDHLSLILSFP